MSQEQVLFAHTSKQVRHSSGNTYTYDITYLRKTPPGRNDVIKRLKTISIDSIGQLYGKYYHLCQKYDVSGMPKRRLLIKLTKKLTEEEYKDFKNDVDNDKTTMYAGI